MEVKRDENSEYEFTEDKRLKSVFTKKITSIKNKKEVEKEIESYKNLIDAGKTRLKNIKNEKKNLKIEVKHIKRDIDACNKRITELSKWLAKWNQ